MLRSEREEHKSANGFDSDTGMAADFSGCGRTPGGRVGLSRTPKLRCRILRLTRHATTKGYEMTAQLPKLPEPLNLIGGKWVKAQSGKTLDVVSPANGKVFASIAASDRQDIDMAVAAARAAFETGEWGRLAAVERGRIMIRIGELITRDAEELAQLESLDTGKPISQARADMVAAARYFEFYGAAADKVHGEHIPFLSGYDVKVVREPYGVTGHISPWNYPAQMVGRTLAPALAMGNATVMKPAEEACLSVLRIARLAEEAGMPAGAINIVTGEGHVAGAALSEHPGIDFISFTGSPEIGVVIQTNAARNFIACTLELGGKSPQIVFEDADLDRVIPVLAAGIVQSQGQFFTQGFLNHRVLFEGGVLAEECGAILSEFFKARRAKA